MKNTAKNYGLISIIFHWLSALTVITLFCLGFWMVNLGYYDSWYKTAPDLHKSIGISLFILMIMRTVWKNYQVQPESLSSHTPIEKKLGHLMHIVLYILIFSIMISGYLISTADGRGIDVFQMFEVASFGEIIENQEDVAGLYHQYAAYTLALLVFFHAAAALKHHFIDRDKTLLRMLGSKQTHI